MSKFIDRTGQTFGRLKVIGRLDNTGPKHDRAYFACRCVCGNVLGVSGGNLANGHTSSCGCLRLETGASVGKSNKNRVIAELSPRNRIMTEYKASAKVKSLEFSLSEKELDDMVFSRCFYCNAKPSRVAFSGRKLTPESRRVLYNGIDRLDSDVGYVKENCVPCCKTCNMMKRDLSLLDFVSKCKEIAATFCGEHIDTATSLVVQ